MEFNKQQLQIINLHEGIFCVSAGAGSGKTSVLIEYISNLINNYGEDERDIMVISFTRAAVDSLKKKLSNLGINSVPVHTFHSLSAMIVTETGIDISKTLPEWKVDNCFNKIIKNPDTKGILSWIGFQKNRGRSCDDEFIYKDIDYSDEQLRVFFKAYESLKKSEKAYDFEDWIMMALEELDKNPRKYKFVICDENQDSNTLNIEMIKKITDNNLMVVGDIRQCLLPETKIKTKDGEKFIKDITIKDNIIIGKGRGEITTTNPNEIIKNIYKGNILTIATKNGHKIKCTPNHIIFTNRIINKPYYVYLMYKPEFGFRIGQSSIYRKLDGQNGFEKRLLDETGFKVWCLETCDNQSNAGFYENYYAFQYGIPLYVFSRKSRGITMEQGDISKLFSSIDTFKRGLKLLKDKNMYFEYPHYIPQRNSKYVNVKINFNMFGNSRQDKGNKSDYIGYKHELSFCTTNKDFALKANDETGIGISKKHNSNNTEYWEGRKVNGKYDELYTIGERLTKLDKDIYIVPKATITKDLCKMDLYPASNIKEGMSVGVLNNNEIICDEVISVTSEYYEGEVYDINVPMYRNYIADNVVVHNCIYAFRGSEPEFFMNFDKEFPDAKVLHLDTNYRSAKNIVANANHFIAPYFKSYKYYSNAVANNQNNGIIKLISNLDAEEESYKIADMIEQKIKDGIEPRDIAVLYRNNSCSEHLEGVLRKKKIPYTITGEGSFFKRNEIYSIICTLRLMENVHDDRAFDGLFKTKIQPFKFFPNSFLDDLKRESGKLDKSLYETFLDYSFPKPYMRNSMYEFHDNITRLTMQLDKDLSIEELIDNIIKVFDTENYIKTKYPNQEECKERLNSLNVLKIFAKGNNLKGFLDFVENGKIQKSKKNENTVKLMTIHRSKGLEWHTVFCIGLEQAIFPSERSKIEEEARLMYVAVTRPISELYISRIGSGGDFIQQYFGASISDDEEVSLDNTNDI